MTRTWKSNLWLTDDPWHWGYNDHAKRKRGFNHAIEVNFPFGRLDHALAWCREQTKDDWRWQLIESATKTQPGRYIFYFDNDIDKLGFTMKWS